MTDNWGNDPIVSGGSAHADWGNDPVVSGAPAKSPVAPQGYTPSTNSSPNALALEQTIKGPPQGGGQQEWFTKQKDIETRLRAAGKSDTEIQSDPQWKEAAKAVNRSVMASGTGTALSVAGGEVGGPALRLIGGKIAEATPPQIKSAIANQIGKAGQSVSRLMPGATAKAQGTVSQIGPVTDIEALGQKMQSDLSGKVQGQIAAQEKAAPATRKLKAEYMSQPPEVEKAILADARDAVLQLRSKMTNITAGQSKIMKEAVEDLSRDPSMENIEATRKDLASIAKYGRPDQGVKSAIDRAFAQQLSGILEKSVRARVPSGAKYIDSANASEELRDFAKSGEPLKADKFFGTKDGLAKLRRLSGGDEKFVSDSARGYIATQLEGKSAAAAKDWMAKNDAWISDLPKEVKASVNDYVSNLDKIASTQQKAWQMFKKSALGAAGIYGLSKAKHAIGLMEHFVE